MSDNNNLINSEKEEKEEKEQEYSLNDDRRVKVLSPGMLVTKRFLRNRLALTGMIALIIMFLFSFVGGLLSPYHQDDRFYTNKKQYSLYAGARENTEFRYLAAPGAEDIFKGSVKASFGPAIDANKDSFTVSKATYTIEHIGGNFYTLSGKAGVIGIAYKDIISSSKENAAFSYEFQFEAQKVFAAGGGSFAADGKNYAVTEEGIILEGENEIAFISAYSINALEADVFLGRQFKEELIEALLSYNDAEKEDGDGRVSFSFINASGEKEDYSLKYNPEKSQFEVEQNKEEVVLDTYSFPTKEHWLGTDGNGMDMLTRLMYGGRISLVIGFIVEIIETSIGVVFGGISGYFGGWVDNLIMRIVDILYCIPSTPILIIIGAAMDNQKVDPMKRMMYLMLILGILGWPSIARLVRGQILSLREQEFMTATEACGISVPHRIFKHLIPNVIPQLIVTCTMGLGSVIITESTLSFLGLGVRFPFASWGNIINDVSNQFVLTTYWFVWIPAGLCLLITVVAFNLVGDGLRDAFDPRMKR